MPITFEALIAHGLTKSDVLALPAQLNFAPPAQLAVALENLERLARTDWPTYQLTREWTESGIMDAFLRREAPTWEKGEMLLFEGPGNLSLSFGHRVCMVGHGIRWTAFLTEVGWRQALRGVACELADFFGGTQAIYMPDSSAAFDLVAGGGSFADVTAWLRAHIGPPAPSIAAIYDSLSDVTEGYFIDTCVDSGQ
jgi:hypothetical protein